MFSENLHDWQEFYTTTGHTGRAKYQLWFGLKKVLAVTPPLVSCPTRWSLYWPLALCVDHHQQISRETGYSNVLHIPTIFITDKFPLWWVFVMVGMCRKAIIIMMIMMTNMIMMNHQAMLPIRRGPRYHRYNSGRLWKQCQWPQSLFKVSHFAFWAILVSVPIL